ncbi:MAG: hypothetical protein UR28_C0029G0042 [Candidatus Peregrinibacteria bacterium GW2011_GWF2_33_10]|nr:MAG: hypothetical protein UR28_C0029G0042 [Candidatus Peregrinibacteria bacterium GW2011_GWF2_33_10]OGJ45412.1 MAG: hypothetical protein A2263_04050 [Candidatus Peregrinibacteria bacterium RIFOXYA2_FULL_33_21]OGJ45533.1 MAG: hypothetical protein A2272_00970 [Candidatus Peregrinibacteria bacterium RIFOXYA12_FULL_33_12]OGJ51015.1 MAG: hypothetical protein A2307_05645 [Candidatus Peregrinibacteria bacterium RIFOXYB2_FULL_33_20]
MPEHFEDMPIETLLTNNDRLLDSIQQSLREEKSQFTAVLDKSLETSEATADFMQEIGRENQAVRTDTDALLRELSDLLPKNVTEGRVNEPSVFNRILKSRYACMILLFSLLVLGGVEQCDSRSASDVRTQSASTQPVNSGKVDHSQSSKTSSVKKKSNVHKKSRQHRHSKKHR